MPGAGLEPLEPSLGHRQVGHQELEIEPLEVAHRVDTAVGMRIRRVLERPGDVEQRVRIAQPAQVVGGQLLGPDMPLRGGGRRRQVGIGDVGMDDLLWLEDRGQGVETRVRDLHHPDVEGDPAVAAGLGMAAGERVEDSGLARTGKTDDGDLHGGIVAGISSRRSGPPR